MDGGGPTNEFLVADGRAFNAHLTNLAKHSINVLEPPSSLVALKFDGTDETVAFQALLDYAGANKVNLVFPPLTLKFTSVNWPLRVNVIGSPISPQSAQGTIFQSLDNTKNLLVLPNNPNYVSMSAKMENIILIGGLNQIYASDGAVDLCLENITFSGPVNAGFWSRGFLQELWWRNIHMAGGNYGFYHEDASGISGAGNTSLIDKCVFDTTYAHGQAINGWYVKTTLGTSNIWIHPQIVYVGQDGFVASNGRNWTMLGLNTEIASGYETGGTGTRYETTGSITAGTNQLTVVDPTGFVVGQTITVIMANNGIDLETTISSIAGNVFTLAANAGNTVSGVPVTNAQYSIINGVNTQFIFINCSVVQGYDHMLAKYAVVNANYSTYIGCSMFRISDTSCTSTIIGGQCSVVHSNNGNAYQKWIANQTPAGGVNARTTLVSGPGQNLLINLLDSLSNSTGTIGKLEIRKADPNATQLLLLDSADGWLQLRGGISPGTVDANGNNLNGYQRIFVSAGIPTGGAWRAGDIILNNAPTAGGIFGWMCVTAGTPGVWKAMGTLAA